MRAMDYWLTDPWVNPPETQPFHTERFWYLPRCFVCYTPPQAPPAAPPPLLRNGFVTFGVFNNASKIQPGALALWQELLRRVPGSRLLFKAMHFADPPTRQRFLSTFTEQGIAPERVHFLGPSQEYQYLLDFNRVDVALDTFPNNGNTTTHDTLWMGVPVVVMKGDSCVSRVGYSILRQLGHEEWVAGSGEAYLRIALELAGDPERLKALRLSLRGEMAASGLCDGAGFAREVEQAFRGMWRRWCETAAVGG
jgi:predicted O-linked N-acetylglucosamine transferase (SPINDLY family)